MDLFPETKDFQPSTHIDLDRDAALWDDYITQQIKKLTKNKAVSIVIAWNQKDVKKGYAVGSVIVKSTESDTKFIVPVIVKDFKLAPMDTALTSQGKMSVLNENSVDDLLFDGNLGTNAVTKKEQPYEDIIPSAGGGSYTKTASIMAQIADSIHEEDWKRVQREISKPEILYKFAGDKSVFIEMFKHKLVAPAKPEKQVEVIKKLGPDSYMMMSNSIENFDPALQIVSTGKIVDFINGNIPEEHRKSFVETMDNDGVVLDWTGKKDGVHMVDDSGAEKVTPLSDPGFYRVKGPNGEVDGMYIKVVYEPIKDKKSSNPVFISGAGGGPQQGKPKGISIKDAKLPIREARAGDYGYFLYIYEDEPVLVGPYTVKAVGRTVSDFEPPADGDLTVALEDGSQAKITFSDYSSGFNVYNRNSEGTRYEKSIRDLVELTLPSKDCAWVPCNEIWEIGKIKEEVMKTAGVRMRKLESGYEIDGLDGLTGPWRHPKDELEAAFVLRCCGATMEKVAAVIDHVNRKGTVYMNASLSKMEKKAAVKHDLRFVPKSKLMKVASLFEDMTTVDAVLSLNFINNDNISKFVTALPQFEKVREELLRLLIVCRLGNIEIPENVIKQAIDIMEQVINGLHTLKARM